MKQIISSRRGCTCWFNLKEREFVTEPIKAGRGRSGILDSVKIEKKNKIKMKKKTKKGVRCGQIIGLASWEMERDREQKVGDGM